MAVHIADDRETKVKMMEVEKIRVKTLTWETCNV